MTIQTLHVGSLPHSLNAVNVVPYLADRSKITEHGLDLFLRFASRKPVRECQNSGFGTLARGGSIGLEKAHTNLSSRIAGDKIVRDPV